VVTSSSIAWKASSLLGAVAALHLALTAPSRSTLAPDARARLARAVAASTHLAVAADDLVFERTRPVSLQDSVFGRALWFTGRARPGAPRDVYRAEVRLTPDGTLLGLRALANLTRSPLGDDGPLVPETDVGPETPRRLAVASRAFGQVQSAFVLDPAGDAATAAQLRREITNALETGTRAGVARYDLRLDRPADRVALRFVAHDRVALDAGARRWTVDLAALRTTPAEGVTLTRQQRVDKPLVIWAVDTVRSLPFVGGAPIAWLEQRAFAVRDAWHQRSYRWFGRRPPPATAAEAPAEDAAGRVIAGAVGGAADPSWPPAPIAPPLGAADPGEGRWVNATPPWTRHLDGAPPAFYRTFVRLDDERPYTRVLLVAMDMRQLELGLQAGVEDPVPSVGPRGDGRIPRTPGLMPRVVGAFNGAFKTEHGAYGMAVDGRVLLPPQPNAATVVTLDDGRIAMGTWDGLATLPAAVRSLRQNLEPLLADGVENPTRRGLWGFVLGGIESMPTVRSGLCSDDRGHLYYAWGEETTARRLGRAMRLAGCTYGMHLDMNPTHATFHFLRVDDVAHRQFQFRALDEAMQSHGDRFLYYTLKDFFYLAVRPTLPAPVRGAAWTAVRPQPAPAWMPGVTTLRVALAPGREATVDALAADRVRLHLRAGRREPATTLVAEDRTYVPSAEHPLLGAIELGAAASLDAPRGLCVGGRVQLPFVAGPHAGHLAVRAGVASIEAGVAVAADVREALQGVLVRRAGAATGWSDPAVLPRQVLATTADGRLLVIAGAMSGDELAALLGDLGAVAALLFERASGGAHWTGDEGLRDAWPESALFIEGAAAPSPVLRLEGWLRGQRGA
jgi:hypothetical protein